MFTKQCLYRKSTDQLPTGRLFLGRGKNQGSVITLTYSVCGGARWSQVREPAERVELGTVLITPVCEYLKLFIVAEAGAFAVAVAETAAAEIAVAVAGSSTRDLGSRV